MKLIIMGPQASGKGTYASRVSKVFNIPHISTGDIFRENIKKQTELGKKVEEPVNAGILVADDIVNKVIAERIKEVDCENGFLLDGYPRNLNQAEELERMGGIDFVINLVVPEEILIKRITSRVICRNCSEIYNKLFLKPKVDGVCDKCGGELYIRADETPEVVKKRLALYREKTAPLIEFYNKKGVVKNIENNDINIPPEPIVNKILEALGREERI